MGWVNTDVVSNETTHPDVVVSSRNPLPFKSHSFDAVYLGHVLEHIPWTDVLGFLDLVKTVAKPDAHVLVVGPDVHRTLRRWRQGHEPWEMVLAAMEHQSLPGNPWTEAAHHWNCHQQRVVTLLDAAGFVATTDLATKIPNDVHASSWNDPRSGITWPVVGKWHWQFALGTRVPGV